ncbi:hypothetical protein NN561_014518 [Cricetulus griseus]
MFMMGHTSVQMLDWFHPLFQPLHLFSKSKTCLIWAVIWRHTSFCFSLFFFSLRQAERGRLVVQLRCGDRLGFLGLGQEHGLPFQGHGTGEVARGQRPEPPCSGQEESGRNCPCF